MGYWKSLFLKWKRENYPDIKFNGEQVDWVHIYFQNHESGESELLPPARGVSQCQSLIAEFWEDMQERVGKNHD